VLGLQDAPGATRNAAVACLDRGNGSVSQVSHELVAVLL
jgi:hypothetical protein